MASERETMGELLRDLNQSLADYSVQMGFRAGFLMSLNVSSGEINEKPISHISSIGSSLSNARDIIRKTMDRVDVHRLVILLTPERIQSAIMESVEKNKGPEERRFSTLEIREQFPLDDSGRNFPPVVLIHEAIGRNPRAVPTDHQIWYFLPRGLTKHPLKVSTTGESATQDAKPNRVVGYEVNTGTPVYLDPDNSKVTYRVFQSPPDGSSEPRHIGDTVTAETNQTAPPPTPPTDPITYWVAGARIDEGDIVGRCSDGKLYAMKPKDLGQR